MIMAVLFYNRKGDEKRIIDTLQFNYHRTIVVINNKKMAKEIENPPICCKYIQDTDNQEIEQLKRLMYSGEVECI